MQFKTQTQEKKWKLNWYDPIDSMSFWTQLNDIFKQNYKFK